MHSGHLLTLTLLAATATGNGPARAEMPALPPPVAAICEPANFNVAHLTTAVVPGCFISAATKGPVHYEVTFPAGYDPSKKEPFVIFLHGRGGSETQFRDFGGADAIDGHVKKGGKPFVVVAPGEPKHSYWKDGPAKEFGTASMVAEDLVKHVEEMPGIQSGREARAIMGISMGGHGSFYLAEKRPDIFSGVYAMSPIFRAPEELLEEDVSAFGKAAAFTAQDPVGLYESRAEAKRNPLPNLRSAIEIGKDDPFLTSSVRTKAFIRRLQADMGETRVDMSRPGGHDPEYWRGAFERAADFMGENFSERAPAAEPSAPLKPAPCAARFGELPAAAAAKPKRP